MQYLGLGAIVVIFFLALPGSPKPPSSPEHGAIQPGNQAAAMLEMVAGELTVKHEGHSPLSLGTGDFQPYRIIYSSHPAVVTTIDEQLFVTTIVAGAKPATFPNMLPLVTEPPFCILAELTVAETAVNGKTVIANPAGDVVWSTPEGMLLYPIAGALPSQTYMFADTPGATLMSPMGNKADLVLVDAHSGKERWSTELSAVNEPIDVGLMAADADRGLLLLQYGYVAYEFVVLNLANGKVLKRWQFVGQPSTQTVYPGAVDEPAMLELDSGVASMLVINHSEVIELWHFDLNHLTLEKTPADAPARNLEQNDLPPGGSGIPNIASPPFPQTILPTEYGADWSIPALVNYLGQVLIIDGEKAYWLGDHLPEG